ncbi:hypothetical protein Aperf_G00000099052 [Anoplocephala perfoliata]
MEMREEILNQGEESSDADRRRRMLVKELLDSFYSVTVAPAFEKDMSRLSELFSQNYRDFWKELWTLKKQAVIGAALRTSLELRILVQKKQVHLSESRGFPGTEEPSSNFFHMTSRLTDVQLAAPSASRTAANNYNSAKVSCTFGDSGYSLPIDETHANAKSFNNQFDLASK